MSSIGVTWAAGGEGPTADAGKAIAGPVRASGDDDVFCFFACGVLREFGVRDMLMTGWESAGVTDVLLTAVKRITSFRLSSSE